MNLQQKLWKIQNAVNVLKKDKTVEGTAGFMYLSDDKILMNIKPLMNKLRIMLEPQITNLVNERHDYEVVSYQRDGSAIRKPKSEILTTANIIFTFVDADTGECKSLNWMANGMNGWDKGVTAAMSMAKRNFQISYFQIATDEKDDVNCEGFTDEYQPYDEVKDPIQPQEEPEKTPAPTHQANSSKPLLTPNSEQWKGAAVFIAQGGTVEQIRKKYRLTQENEKALLEQAKLEHA